MKQQMLQKEVDKLTKENEKLKADAVASEFIINTLREKLLLHSADNQAFIDAVVMHSKKIKNLSEAEAVMCNLLKK